MRTTVTFPVQSITALRPVLNSTALVLGDGGIT